MEIQKKMMKTKTVIDEIIIEEDKNQALSQSQEPTIHTSSKPEIKSKMNKNSLSIFDESIRDKVIATPGDASTILNSGMSSAKDKVRMVDLEKAMLNITFSN